MACADVPVELGNMSPHLAEAMLVVEDMPILKRINVMVGVTRSKVFFFGTPKEDTCVLLVCVCFNVPDTRSNNSGNTRLVPVFYYQTAQHCSTCMKPI